ncbi:MAG: apolipoprotein N-acyltransferase [Alphaproteobacteria bacterium]|nr:apolipoprotein N-acyltransferase [Alphaproteobacteria bacterium]
MTNAVKSFKQKVVLFLGLMCAGAVGSLVFPPFVNSLAGYAALILFLFYLLGTERSPKELFWSAYAFGFGFYAVGFSWISNALLIDDQRFAALVPVVFLATGGFFGLFWAIPAALSGKIKERYGRVLLFCAAFVFFEWVRSFIFTGFPWNLLGTALSFDIRLIQGAAEIGTYGLSLMLMMFLCGAALLGESVKERRFLKGCLFFLFIPLFFVLGTGYGAKKLEKGESLTVRLVQPSIPQTLKWHKAVAYKNFREYIDLSKEKNEESGLNLNDVDLVFWGETACPYFLDYDREHLLELTEAVPQNGFLVTGLLRVGMENGKTVSYNSMFVINGRGEIKDYYDKAHLVPFGEYLPFRTYLPDFMRPIAGVIGDLGRGEKYKLIKVAGVPVMGGAICYESIFPHEVLNKSEKPEILAVLANDGWYGVSAGPYQHLAAAQMRAVEEGVTVIRSANTGISAVIAPNGEILGRIELNEIGARDVKIDFKLSKNTIYGQWGNLVLAGLLVLFLLGAGVSVSINNCYNRK